MSKLTELIDGSITSVSESDLFGVEKIGHYAFFGCTSLTSITIPDSVTSIWVSSFSGCTNLTEINIPKNVTSIGDSAFYGCTNLIDTTILRTNTIITLGEANFNTQNNLIYVPYSLFASYRSANNWSPIASKIKGYKEFTVGEIFPQYDPITGTSKWYPSKNDLRNNTNGIIATGSNGAPTEGIWYLSWVAGTPV